MKKIYYLFILLLPFVNANGQLWGVTSRGGNYGMGVIFKTNSDGTNYSVQHQFYTQFPGANPINGLLIEAPNGRLYGMTSKGGINNQGVIFEYNQATSTYIKKFDFSTLTGSNPWGSLTVGSNGKLYGMTNTGGSNGVGVLFEFDPSIEVYTKKLDFASNLGTGPQGNLFSSSNGKLYGMTSFGGNNNLGVLFEYDPLLNIYLKKLDFTSSTVVNPSGSLLEATNGKMYGVSAYGGIYGFGILFEYDPSSGILTKKIDFNKPIDGGEPNGQLTLAANGKIYGTTKTGGANSYGTLFEFDPSLGIYVKKMDFDFTSGIFPYGNLIQITNGKFYGKTFQGGDFGQGTLFEYDASSGAYIKKIDFTVSNRLSGGSLIQASNGKIYGVTSTGGTSSAFSLDFAGGSGYGTLFEYDPVTQVPVIKVNFSSSTDGSNPYGGLMIASNGKLYGMTSEGGLNNVGVLFEFNPTTGVYTKLVDLSQSIGAAPYGSLIEASLGKLYGMTSLGGSSNRGTIFEYNFLTSTYTKKFDFNTSTKSRSFGSLNLAANGKLYGMNSDADAGNIGTLFEYDYVTSSHNKRLDFTTTTAAQPLGSLIESQNGKLYGMTATGGSNERGVIFEFDPSTNSYVKKVDFNGTNGSRPLGDLIELANGKFYGMTKAGGVNNRGVIFEYDPLTSLCQSKMSFDSNSGDSPRGGLVQTTNGKLYGMTITGGTSDSGVLFEFDPTSGTYSKKLDFAGQNGANPSYVTIHKQYSNHYI